MSLCWRAANPGPALARSLAPQGRGIHSVDAKWLEKWKALVQPDGSTRFGRELSPDAPQYYQLAMIPYPSGRLHIGHLRVYTISDTLARFRRMKGWKVVHPMGWDAFGLPAENAAIEHNVSARDWTYNHIEEMRAQMKRMLTSFDWDQEIITSSPEYYRHTQQLFLELFRHGLAYRKRASVNWDPVDQTVLANEQIDGEGRSWRSGAVAEKRDLEQWFLRLTEFAPELARDLDRLEDWPDMVKTMQRNWIGISAGARVRFADDLWAFTTRIETLPGVKFVAVAMDHPLAVANAASTHPSGLIEGVEATNPLTGDPLPVYAAEYVVSDYAEGVVMGVPPHDERDRQFWHRVGPASEADCAPVIDDTTGMMIGGPQQLRGLAVDEARRRIMELLQPRGLARPEQHTRLRDWLVSRQRFWGAPIPIIHCDSCGVVPVPEQDLPVELPSSSQKNNVPLSQNREWLQTTCPQCGSEHAHRDPDTMDTFMDSSWYYFRNLDAHNEAQPFAYDKVSHGNMPVDFYIGGVEHAILHLLYSRFLAKFLARTGKWDGGDLSGEPFRKLVTLGMVHGKAYKDARSGRYLKPDEVAARAKETMVETTEKMSKSKYNGADPLEVIEEHGADAVRAHMLFQAPVTETLVWDTDKIVGIKRWLGRIAQIEQTLFPTTADESHGSSTKGGRPGNATDLWNQAVGLVERLTVSLNDTLTLNTVISDEMKLTKLVADLAKTDRVLALQAYEVLIKVLAPVCPAQADEFWESLCRKTNREWTTVHHEAWPQLSRKSQPTTGTAAFRVIINGKPRMVEAPASSTSEELLSKLGMSREQTTRVVFKPDMKLLSIVCK